MKDVKMRRLRARFPIIAFLTLIFSLGLPQSFPVLAQDPTDWQESATGLSVYQNDEGKTSGLGFVVQARNWPFLSLRGGVEDAGFRSALAGPIGIELGLIKLSDCFSATLTSRTLDWAHNEMTFNSGMDDQLTLWASRISPALLIQSSSDSLRLLAGDVTGNNFDGSAVTPRPVGPAYPKYAAYIGGGNLQIETLGTSGIPLSLDENWLLLWYGDYSHFLDTKKPLSYTGYAWEFAGLPHHTEAYQADAPLLLVFQNTPTTIKHSDEGGIELSFTSAAGSVTLLPLLGRDHPNAGETEIWSGGLPSDILQKAQWWADHLCSYPGSVNETYVYNETTDTAIITEDIDFLTVCSEGTAFAPIPPMLSIVKDELNVTFSGPITDGNLNTEFGPSLGIEDTQTYSWSVSGLKRYTDARRTIINTGQAPLELEQELIAETAKIINAGHYAPWIFSDNVPRGYTRGDIYWLNPADVLSHLAEVAEVLTDTLRAQFLDHIQIERSVYPPEDVFNLPLDEGTVRTGFSVSGEEVYDQWLDHRPDVFLEDVPLYNLDSLSRYYDLTGGIPSSQVWQRALEVLDGDMREQDWATFYWFAGFEDRREAVINANQHFSGLVGFIRLAEMAEDIAAESLGRALLAKAAVLRLGMARYPRHLYSANLVELPPEPDWQVRYTAGRYIGNLFNYDWTGPNDDLRQVAVINQFEVSLHDHTAFGYWIENYTEGYTSAHLTAYWNLSPELARFLTDHADQDVEIYINKVEALFPQWYVAFAEGALGVEHNLSHPIDSFQIFMAKALIQQENPQKLAAYVDIPWLNEGDLFYIHKLAETIRAYRGVAWDDTVSLSGAPGDRTIHLAWRVYTPLPSGTTWQIDYDRPTGDQPSPITGILSPTRTYSLTGLTNYTWYTVTVSAMSDGSALLTSNVVAMWPTDILVYLPLVLKAW